MQSQVIFRDYQEQVAADHNDLQAFTRKSFDDLVRDAVTTSRRYADFTVSKSGQVEVTVSAGRFYDQTGAVYARDTALVQSLTTYLAAAARRIVVVSAFGAEIETDVEARDFEIDVETRAVEPRAVAMTRLRQAQLVFTAGAESADPQPAPVPATHVVIAHVLLDTTQVVSITMQAANRVRSTDALSADVRTLDEFRSRIAGRVDALGSTIADLSNALTGNVQRSQLQRVMEDVARIKEVMRLPANASGYDADVFLLPTKSDVSNAATLGHDCLVAEGVRFATANAAESEISLFSANDPHASLVNGLLLPRYSDELRIQTGDFVSDLGLAQYGFQTITQQVGYMSRSRLRYGGSYTVCSNSANWDVVLNAPGGQNLYDLETVNLTTSTTLYASGAYIHERRNAYWFDTWREPFMFAQLAETVISGAMVAQTFLVSNDLWATKLGFWIAAKGAAENIRVTLCEVTNGQPDLARTVLTATYAHASIVAGWNELTITPTFLSKGRRYAIVLISNANHRIGMTSGQSYLDGTFFTSTDGVFFLGDLTKDMMLRIYGARFTAPQVTIEFAPLNLDGGFRTVDLLAEMWAPASTSLVFEMRPNGSGEWQPLAADTAAILANAPPLAQFRGRFIGTRDMMPAIKLDGSRVRVARPKTSKVHVSTPFTIPASTTLVVKVLLESFDDTPHDFGIALRHGGAGVNTTAVNPTTTVSRTLSAADGRVERTYTWTVTGITTFRLVMTGATNSAASTYHVAEMSFYTT